MSSKAPSEIQIAILLDLYNSGRLADAEKLALAITVEFPEHQLSWKLLGTIMGQTGRYAEALSPNQKAVQLAPQDSDAHYNLGLTLAELNEFDEAEKSYANAIALNPKNFQAHTNLGNTHKSLGKLEEAVASYETAIALNPNYALAHNNLGNALLELARLTDAQNSYLQAVKVKPDYADAFWNLSSCEKSIKESEQWIDQVLVADANAELARLTKAALRFYQGDIKSFDGLMQSEFKKHPYMRSFLWVFSLPNLPELHFNKWCFFDAIIKKSIISKPFYEFGVWRASSFKYLIKSFKKGYGFDTFTGLPEDLNLGDHIEKEGTYTSDGNVPKIRGGEFIVGKFEDTLPVFFAKSRPIASVLNFDADLYSSTICALNYSKVVMDKDTILVFDEFIINERWEQDEFKALNEFCSINNFSYEVIAVSFFTKQVAVKLIGI